MKFIIFDEGLSINDMVYLKNFAVLAGLVILSVLMYWSGLRLMLQNYSDRQDVARITGLVEYTEIVPESARNGLHTSAFLHQKHLAIKLEETEKIFGTYANSSRAYNKLQNKLKPGQEVTLSYYNSDEKNPYSNIYEVKVDGQTILDHNRYNKNNTRAAIIDFLAGFIFLGGGIFLVSTKKMYERWV